jgi:hypothetical protein
MAVFIFPSEYLNPVTDSVNTQQILYRGIVETNPASGFSDNVAWGYSYTAAFNEDLFTMAATASPSGMYYVTAHTPLVTRQLTSTYLTTDIQTPQWPVTAYFLPNFNTPVSAFFVGNGELDTVIDAYFAYTASFPATAYFVTPTHFDTPVRANLGSFNKDFHATAIFDASLFKDFPARITIQPVTIPTKPNYSAYSDFNAKIQINPVVKKDFNVVANFRVPPINMDYHVTARFAGHTFMYITNLGTGEVHTCKIDVDGFWHVDGLLPGSYSIQPKLGGITFNPPIQYFTITDASPTLYFTEVGVYDINNPFG